MSLRDSIKSIYFRSIRRSAAANFPWLAAVLLLPVLKTVKPARTEDARTVVILPKEGFAEDVMAALADADRLMVVTLPRVVVKLMAAPFLPYFIDDNNYLSSGAEYDAAKQRYRRFLLSVFKALMRIVRVDAMITGNFSYASERELAAAMQELGVPFIAMHKENLKTPGRVAFFERLYRERRGPFTGRKILVYNEIERDLQIRAGVVEESRITITGMPRLDRMHAWRRAHAGEATPNRVLFFVFSSATGMPRVPRKGREGGHWFEDEETEEGDVSLARLSKGVCQAVLRVAMDNPDIEVVVKSKGRKRDFTETAALFGVATEAELPPNMRVVHGGDVLDLIAEASVICGFNSTALLEAVAAGKPVVVPWFAEAEQPNVLPYLIDLRTIGVTVSSPEDMQKELVRQARAPRPVPAELDVESMKTLAAWTGNDDGGAALRARAAIVEEMTPALSVGGQT